MELHEEEEASPTLAAAGSGELINSKYTDIEVYAQDGIQLVDRFVAKGSTEFKDFQEEWIDSKFYYIHCMGQDDANKNLITEMVCSTMTSIVVDEDQPLLERIGAVYVWYAIYNTQATPAPVHIRLSQSDWSVVSSLEHQLKGTQAGYIINKLRSSCAFHLCYGRQRFYPGLHKEAAARDTVLNVKKNVLKDSSQLIQTLKGADQLQQQYTSLKDSLKEHLPTHLLDSFGFGNLLTDERIKQIAHPSTSSQDDMEEDIATLVPVTSSNTRKRKRRNILQSAYTSSPGTSWRGV